MKSIELSNEEKKKHEYKPRYLSIFHWMFLIMFYMKLDGRLDMSWPMICWPLAAYWILVRITEWKDIDEEKKKKQKKRDNEIKEGIIVE